MNNKQVVYNIRKNLKEYILNNNIKSLVLGVSGGVDSALVAALAYKVCEELSIPLLLRSLPETTNKKEEIIRAGLVNMAFSKFSKTTDISEMALNLIESFVELDQDTSDYDGWKVRRGNVKARLRMIYLYDVAAKNKGMVLGTDNLTEYYLGFFTLGGDGLSDYGMIQNLWKTEVYELAECLVEADDSDLTKEQREALAACINSTPTDGLGITNSDLDQLGANSYLQVDIMLKDYLVNKFSLVGQALEGYPVIQRYNRTHFKRNHPVTIKREELFREK